ncbi:single-stranded DNA-binding protein [Paraburkholderia hospita]|uniref:single-stranded DNA-binding protein n=1 Tax=Paraburkholderia hospita TaxID=169430 RepID=UPI0008A7E246|nr:single-stranded DNA-binding protein [Paraburkholderia hospita]SEI14608.1 single-strand DNA-binding protein [Paraburkholderia hospita]
MGSINKQILLGRLTANAEGRSLPNDSGTVANLKLVTHERYQDKGTGEWKEFADYHRVSVFGQLADEARNLKEGTEVYVEGRTRTRKYQQHGQDRYITEVVASVLFPTGAGEPARIPASSPAHARAGSPAITNAPGSNAGDDDAPF